MPSSERQRELRRRRKRKKQLTHLKQKVDKASPAEKAVIADKVRKLTPGAKVVLDNWGLED